MTYLLKTISRVILVGCKKLSFCIVKIEKMKKGNYWLILHSVDNDFIVVKNTRTKMPIEINRNGIS